MSTTLSLSGLFESIITNLPDTSDAAKGVLAELFHRSHDLKNPVTVIFSQRRGTMELATEVRRAATQINAISEEHGVIVELVGMEWTFDRTKGNRPNTALVTLYPDFKDQDIPVFGNVFDAEQPEAPALASGVA